MAFHPDTLDVAPGDTVVWVNVDLVPHTATAAAPDAWDTGTLARSQEGWIVPEGTGEVRYLCRLHPTMEGSLNVRDQLPRPSARHPR